MVQHWLRTHEDPGLPSSTRKGKKSLCLTLWYVSLIFILFSMKLDEWILVVVVLIWWKWWLYRCTLYEGKWSFKVSGKWVEEIWEQSLGYFRRLRKSGSLAGLASLNHSSDDSRHRWRWGRLEAEKQVKSLFDKCQPHSRRTWAVYR